MVVMGADLLFMLCIAGLVTKPIPARIQYAPSAVLDCTEVIAMRVLGHSALGNYKCLRVPELLSCGVPNIVLSQSSQLFFFLRQSLLAPRRGREQTLSLQLRLKCIASPIINEGLA